MVNIALLVLAVIIVFLALLLLSDSFPIAHDTTRTDVFLRLIGTAILLVIGFLIVAKA